MTTDYVRGDDQQRHRFVNEVDSVELVRKSSRRGGLIPLAIEDEEEDGDMPGLETEEESELDSSPVVARAIAKKRPQQESPTREDWCH